MYQRRSGHVALNRVQQSCEGVRVWGQAADWQVGSSF